MTDLPEYPTLLSVYVVRPPWQVAGVDYYVGVPSSVTLLDPSTIHMAGVSINGHEIDITGNNVTLNGYNFNGWNVYITGTNETIENSLFTVPAKGTAIPVDAVYGGFVTLLNNTFNGGGAQGATPNDAFRTGTGGALVEYNHFTNFANDGIDVVNPGNVTIKYNLFDNLGYGGYHTDAIQSYFSSLQSFDVEYNTMYEPPSAGAGGINDFMRIGDQGSQVVSNPIAAHNTLIFNNTGGSANAFQFYSGSSSVDGTLLNPTIHDNYIDQTTIDYAVAFISGATNPTTYNNVNLTNDHAILNGPYNSKTANIPANPPAAPVITGEANNTVSGTGPGGDTITVYDQGNLLGFTQAGSNGAWSLTNSSLATGNHSLTAVATDAYANTSASSAVINIGSGGSPPPPAPTIDSFSPDTSGIDTTNSVTLSGRTEANSTVTVFDGTTNLGAASVDSSGAWTLTEQNAANGVHTFTATATDANGTSAPSAQFSVTVNAPIPTTNLVVNGGFETGDFTGWTIGPYQPGQTLITTNAHSGNYAVALGPAGADGSLSQQLATTPGQHYTLDFWLANMSSGPDDFTIKWNGTAVAPKIVNENAQGYTEYKFDLTATGATTALEFDYRQDPTQWRLDDVSVTAGTATQGLAVIGTTGNDTLTNLPGTTSDLLTGNGGIDTFVFHGAAFGNDTITDFVTGSHHDIIQLDHTVFANFAAVQSHAAQVGSNVVITIDAADSVTLLGVHLSSLRAADFHFV